VIGVGQYPPRVTAPTVTHQRDIKCIFHCEAVYGSLSGDKE